ncbi:MAG: hypothetical protein EA378_03195 [Phycisphaerales bacterium]|nr:MAG: hypothetical protein EA378_03195 [Phycisphaerales bacterium]
MTRSYANAAAFRQALETRLRNIAQQRGVQIHGLRLKVAIERLLARLFHEPNQPWLLKGGYAMELRFRPKARTTRDLDLTLGDPARTGRRARRRRRIQCGRQGGGPRIRPVPPRRRVRRCRPRWPRASCR